MDQHGMGYVPMGYVCRSTPRLWELGPLLNFMQNFVVQHSSLGPICDSRQERFQISHDTLVNGPGLRYQVAPCLE